MNKQEHIQIHQLLARVRYEWESMESLDFSEDKLNRYKQIPVDSMSITAPIETQKNAIIALARDLGDFAPDKEEIEETEEAEETTRAEELGMVPAQELDGAAVTNETVEKQTFATPAQIRTDAATYGRPPADGKANAQLTTSLGTLPTVLAPSVTDDRDALDEDASTASTEENAEGEGYTESLAAFSAGIDDTEHETETRYESTADEDGSNEKPQLVQATITG